MVLEYRHMRWLVAVVGMGCFLTAGCQPSAGPSSTATKTTPASGHEDHDHDDHAHHDHGDHGEHGGHLLHLDPSGSHAEWTHDDEAGSVTVYLEELVASGKKVESVEIEWKVGDAAENNSKLEVAAKDDHGIEGSIFTIKNPELVTALGVGDGVVANLVVTVDGKKEMAKLEHDHGHDHDH